MENALKKAKSSIERIILYTMPTIFWLVFSVKRLFSVKKCFGFLSEEFFAKNFLKDGLCDIGGFGMTAKIISQYYSDKQSRDFEATALFNRTLHKQREWWFHVNDSLVFTIPELNEGYIKCFLNFLKYSFRAQKNFHFLLSIDLYPGYEFSLKAMPHTPLLIWLRDPKSEVELRKIGTIEHEIRVNKMHTLDEFMTFAKRERDFFYKTYEQSKAFKRPIIFVTNAHCLTPRAQRLYNLRELNPHFLPNPIYYSPLERIQKSKQPTVCLLGRLDPVKRPWIFFELAKKFKNVDFLVCGQSSYPQVINPIIEQYQSVENLKFLGLVEGENKAEILSKSWVLVNTSIHEGLPCSFLESFSYGTPIISSVNPDDLVSKFGFYTGENLGDGTDEHTMKRFQEGLGKILSDKKELERLGLEAREYVEKIYNFDMFEKSLRNILSERFKINYASVNGKTVSKSYKFKITKEYIKEFVFKQKCIPWRIIESWRRIIEFWRQGGAKEWWNRIQRRIKSFIRKFIIRIFWLEFLFNRTFYRKKSLRVGFLSDEFEHLDLMPFGGHGMTLKFVTDYLNNNGGLLKADVLMCNRKDASEVTVKRYHSADLMFLPQHQNPSVYFKCAHLLEQKGINVFIGIEHRTFYEFYLKNFPYIPWVIWIKAPRDKEILKKISTIPLEIKTQNVDNLEELIRNGEEDAESLRKMLRISRAYGRKIYFGAESNHLAEIARRKYGLDDINAFHWPNPIPLPAIEKQTFSERPSFLLLGRLDPIKRPWIFFELAKRFKDADFYVAGSSHCPEIMDPVIAKYKDVLNLKFTGRIEGKDKVALLERVWAVVNTSIHEGVPVSVLEGFSYGKPAIAALDPDGLTSRFGIYVGEVLGDGDDSESLDRFSSAIEKMMGARFDKESVGQQARQYIATFHSFEYFESTLLRILNSPSNFEYRVY